MSTEEEKIHKAMLAPVLAMIPAVVVGPKGYNLPDMFSCRPLVGDVICQVGDQLSLPSAVVSAVGHCIDEHGLPYLLIIAKAKK